MYAITISFPSSLALLGCLKREIWNCSVTDVLMIDGGMKSTDSYDLREMFKSRLDYIRLPVLWKNKDKLTL